MIPAIVLAAGASTRMGRPKALLPLGGETFLSRIVKTLRDAEVDDLLVVIGHEGAMITASLAPLAFPVRVVENPDYSRGQLSSLQAGLRAADRPGVRGVLVTLVDLPLISSSTVRAVLDAYRRHPTAAIVRPVDGNRHGHPVVFDRQLFIELRAGDPAIGAKPIVQAHREAIVGVPVTDEGAFVDIDTPDEYERLIGRFPRKN
ncbi:MAG TPA: nucleotidyltransferase family protein [Vicinamibacterales bacterium]|jgi:molybdenum cofactor cytidylyltransferase